MKVKNILFVTFFLAAASLGLAHPAAPQNSTKTPISSSPVEAKNTAKTDSPAHPAQAILAAANDAGKISPKCAQAILTIFTSAEFLKCVPAPALLPLLPIVTDPTILKKFLADPVHNYQSTVEQPLVQFASLICPAPKCSDDGINGAIKALQDGCGDEIANNQLIQIFFDAMVFYSPIRDITCFKDKDKFCFDETMLTVIKLPQSPFKLTGNAVLDSVAVADPTAVCTTCNKDIVNTIFNFLNDKTKAQLALQILAKLGIDDKKIDGAKVGVAVKCGLGFEDGKISGPKEEL